MEWHTTGSLAKLLGFSRDQILADIRRLGIVPIRDATGRRLLTGSHVQRIIRLHEHRARRRKGGIPMPPRLRERDPGAS